MAADGGYAEYLVVPARNLCRIPDGVSYLEAAIAADAIATPLHACREEARIGPGDRVLIVGAGGGGGGSTPSRWPGCAAAGSSVRMSPTRSWT